MKARVNVENLQNSIDKQSKELINGEKMIMDNPLKNFIRYYIMNDS